MHLLEVPVFGQFNVKVFIKLIKVSLKLLFRRIGALWSVRRILIDVGQENGLGKGRLDVFS